jgi:hypothetical protein
MLHRIYHHIGHDNYLEVETRDGGWVHSRIMHSRDYNRPRGFTPVYHGVYACPEEDLPDVIEKAQSGSHGLWGSDEDY